MHLYSCDANRFEFPAFSSTYTPFAVTPSSIACSVQLSKQRAIKTASIVPSYRHNRVKGQAAIPIILRSICTLSKNSVARISFEKSRDLDKSHLWTRDRLDLHAIALSTLKGRCRDLVSWSVKCVRTSRRRVVRLCVRGVIIRSRRFSLGAEPLIFLIHAPATARTVVQGRVQHSYHRTSSSTKTTTMTTAAKLYGKDLSEYDDIDVDQLLAELTPEELNILAKEVDPDDSFMPPSQRCSYECNKSPTGPLNRKKLIEHINKQALETPDIPELKPYVPGVIRGKKWVPPPQENIKEKEADEQIAIDLGDEYEQALSSATQEEIIDLAAILGFHSMMNQDQYHASLLNSGQPVGLGWDGVTKASQPKVYPMEPPNDTDVDATIKQVRDDDSTLTDLNWNNIKNISDEKFIQLFEGLEINTHLESLSLTNVGLNDKTAQRLADAIEKNSTLKVLNVETNFISPPVIVRLIRSLLKTKSIEEFRCSNQRSQVLGNKIEMEITQLVEQNLTLLRLGLHLEFNDARHRVAAHLQRNIDRIRQSRLGVATS